MVNVDDSLPFSHTKACTRVHIEVDHCLLQTTHCIPHAIGGLGSGTKMGEHSRSSMEATPNFARATQHASLSARRGEASPTQVEELTVSPSATPQDLNTKL